MSTKQELQAENRRLQARNIELGQEVAALRTLLAAVRDLANVPMAADALIDADWNAYLTLCSSRLGSITAWADPDNGLVGPASTETLHTSAERLRYLAALPLRYAPKAPAPADEAWRLTPKGVEAVDAAVITDSERDCDERNPDGSGEPCYRGGDHGVHRDSNGDEWRADAADQVQYGNPFDNEGVWASCGTVWPDGGFVCTLAEGHDGQHQAWSHGEKMPFAVLDQAEASA